MPEVWYFLLGLFFATYLVLGGYDYGVGMLLTRTARSVSNADVGSAHGRRAPGTEAEPRRATLAVLGPFFLGNEVWLVAAVGILFGAFPALEGEFLAGLYPAVLLALVGVVVVTAAVPMRSRPTTARNRHGWDHVVVTGSFLAAFGWGAVMAGWLQGVPLTGVGHVEGVGHVFTPFVLAGGLALAGLIAVHGAALLALRLPVEPAARLALLGHRLVPVALVALVVATVLGLLSERVRQSVQQPAAAVLLPLVPSVALLVARWAFARHRAVLAFAATSAALAVLVLLIGAALLPYALPSSLDPAAGLTVRQAAASEPTLSLLGWLTLPLLPVLLGFQLMCWWVYRGRLNAGTPTYW
ncbi:cytochrome d ubiquinol oxidase subunit II [Plantactinospora sonchi]|uniref:Cytochrome d ubiquinol oxidase subunit II n=1 Tax=Plantactinospora sonchi TaxID=1544735 RepID=A0ABU7RS61_9ACTN